MAARAHVQFSPETADTGHHMAKTILYLGFSHLLVTVFEVLRLPRKMSSRHLKCSTCHTESSSCPKSKMTTGSQNETPELLKTSPSIAPARNQTSKCPACPTPATKNGHRSKNEYGAPVKVDLRRSPGTPFRARVLWKTERLRKFCAVRVTKFAGRTLNRNHASTTTVRAPCVATLFGEPHKLQV